MSGREKKRKGTSDFLKSAALAVDWTYAAECSGKSSYSCSSIMGEHVEEGDSVAHDDECRSLHAVAESVKKFRARRLMLDIKNN